MDLGLGTDTLWYIRNASEYVPCSLAETIDWLNTQIQPDGRFGTDFWDAARFGSFVERHGLCPMAFSYPRLKNHLVSIVREGKILSDVDHWSGPGFIAAAIDYCDLIGESKLGDALLVELCKWQSKDGAWIGVLGPDGYPVIPPAWHTSQALMTLARRGKLQHKPQLDLGLSYLKRTQHYDGSWPAVEQYIIYSTSYVVIALARLGNPDKMLLTKALSYLKSRMTSDGRCSDLGGTLMCAWALAEVAAKDYTFELGLVDCVIATTAIERIHATEADRDSARRRIDELEHEVEGFRAKYSDADIVITKKQALTLAVISLLVTTIGTVVGVFALLAMVGTVGGGK